MCAKIAEEKYRQLHMFVILKKKVKENRILIGKPKCEKSKIVLTPENIASVAESVHEAPSTSIHRLPQPLYLIETNFS